LRKNKVIAVVLMGFQGLKLVTTKSNALVFYDLNTFDFRGSWVFLEMLMFKMPAHIFITEALRLSRTRYPSEVMSPGSQSILLARILGQLRYIITGICGRKTWRIIQ
jgi:hypothetical protein